jgi:hypothetical protein
MSDRRRTSRYLKGKQTDKEFSRHLWNGKVRQGSNLNPSPPLEIPDGALQFENSDNYLQFEASTEYLVFETI